VYSRLIDESLEDPSIEVRNLLSTFHVNITRGRKLDTLMQGLELYPCFFILNQPWSSIQKLTDDCIKLLIEGIKSTSQYEDILNCKAELDVTNNTFQLTIEFNDKDE